MQMANLVDVDASEEDKIKVMINQSIYDPMKWVMYPHTVEFPSLKLLMFSYLSLRLPSLLVDVLFYITHSHSALPIILQFKHKTHQCPFCELHLLSLWKSRTPHQELSFQRGKAIMYLLSDLATCTNRELKNKPGWVKNAEMYHFFECW